MAQVGGSWTRSPPASKTTARLTGGTVARRSRREPRVGAHQEPARLARAGRPADQGELVVADVPSSMERNVRSIPGRQSRSFADFRRGGRRSVFIGQACLKSCVIANYPQRASHGASHCCRRPRKRRPGPRAGPGRGARGLGGGSWPGWGRGLWRELGGRDGAGDWPVALRAGPATNTAIGQAKSEEVG